MTLGDCKINDKVWIWAGESGYHEGIITDKWHLEDRTFVVVGNMTLKMLITYPPDLECYKEKPE